MCRQATLADIPQLIEWGRKFHQLSPWKDREYDEDLVADMLERMITNPRKSIVLMNDEGAVGGIFGALWFNADPLVHELFWFSDGTHGKELLKGLEEWAFKEGAYGVVFSRMHTEDERRNTLIDKVYKRQGYGPGEATFVKMFEDSK